MMTPRALICKALFLSISTFETLPTTGYGLHSLTTNLVSALSRLGRSVGEIMPLIATLVTRQRRVFARKAGLHLTGTHRPTELVRPSLHVNLRYPGAKVYCEVGS
jgi:hypothetical protein